MLTQCEGRIGYQAESCGHSKDAGVVCNKPERKDICSEVKVSMDTRLYIDTICPPSIPGVITTSEIDHAHHHIKGLLTYPGDAY